MLFPCFFALPHGLASVGPLAQRAWAEVIVRLGGQFWVSPLAGIIMTDPYCQSHQYKAPVL